MKHPIHFVIATVSTVLVLGCGPGTSEEHRADHHAHGVGTTAHPDSARWQANGETTDGIHGMQVLADGYPANGLTSGLLRDSLDARMSMIFERCTMKGEAHDALHHYLLPLQDLIDHIPEEKSAAQLDSLRQHLHHYDEVFY